MRQDGAAPTSVAGGSWNIGSQTEHPEIAYAFIKHIASYDGTLGLNLYGGEGALTRPDVYQILKVREVGYAWGEESLVKGAPPPEAANNRGSELNTMFTQYCTILLDRRQPVPFEKGLEDLHKAIQGVLDKPAI
jgi:ABC-type glycerol-3-phosphate transport system substrate-binding protein